MKIFTDFEQYSDDWWRERRGRPSASEFSSIITPAKAQLSKGADAYIFRLLGDLYDVEYPRKDSIATAAMRRGTAMEAESRAYYELHTGVDVQQVGGCLDDSGRFWCSPDFLIGNDGVGELKNPMPDVQLERVYAGVLPDDCKVQCHGHIVVTGRAYCHFLSYCPGCPPLLIRVEPDTFTDKLRAALESFWIRFLEIKTKIEELNSEKRLGLEPPKGTT